MYNHYETASQEAFIQSLNGEDRKDFETALKLRKSLRKRKDKDLANQVTYIIKQMVCDLYTPVDDEQGKANAQAMIEMNEAIKLFNS